MPEQHPLWDSYTSEAEDAPMLPPAEVRRLGDRRRARRRVGVASTALGITLLAGSVLALNTDLFGTREPQWAGPPSPSSVTTSPTGSSSSSPNSSSPHSSSPRSSSAGPTATTSRTITEANLPTGAEIYLVKPNDLVTETSNNFGGRGEQDAHGVCDQGLITLQGPTTRYHRSFSSTTDYQVEAFLMQFSSSAQATAMYSTIAGWYDGCNQRLKAEGRGASMTSEKVLVEDGTTIAYYSGVAAPATPSSEVATFEDSVLMVSGDRVLLMIQRSMGQDNNCVGPYNAQLPQNKDLVGLCHVVKHYPRVMTRLKA